MRSESVYMTVDQLWKSVVTRLLDDHAIHVDCRGGGSSEFIGATFRLEGISNNVVTIPRRKFSLRYACAEFLWYLSGDRSGEMITHYAPKYAQYLDSGEAFGAYGERWKRANQLQWLFKLLHREPNTRRAVLAMWSLSDLGDIVDFNPKDIPCTLNLMFFIRSRYLNCITTMRSNDAWLGLPYDLFCFTTLQMFIADYLGLEYGMYQHNVGSIHLYDKDKERATEAMKQEARLNCSLGAFVSKGGGYEQFRRDTMKALAYERTVRQGHIAEIPFSEGTRWYTICKGLTCEA